MKFPDKGTMLDLFTGSIATLTLFLAYVLFPLVGMLPGLFAPFPALFFTLKRGMSVGAGIVAVVAVVLALMADSTAILLYLLQCGVISLMLPLFLVRGKRSAKAIAYSVAVNLGTMLLLAGVYGVSQGVNLHQLILKGIHASISQAALFYEKAGITGDELKTFQQGVEQAGELIGQVYPAIVAISLVVIAGFNLLLLKNAATRLPQAPELGEFRTFKNPDQLVWVLIVAGFAMLVDNKHLTSVALNVLLITLCLYSIQGLAVIAHFFNRLAVPRLVRIIFYSLLVLQPYLAVAVAALGIFDIWGDFRAPKQQENL